MNTRIACAVMAAAIGFLGGCENKSSQPAPNKPSAPANTTTAPVPTNSGTPATVETPVAPAAPVRAAGDGTSITIGHYGSLTGSEATFGQSTSEGIRLAIKEVNAHGGVLGKQIALVEYDTKGEPKEATLAVTRLVKSDKVAAVLGEVASGLSLAGGPVCQEAGVPMISPSSTNPRVTSVGDMIFRVCFIDPFQGMACAKFAREDLKLSKAAVLYDQKAPYSVGLAQEFKKNFTKMGGTIVTDMTYTGGDQDFTTQLTNIRSAKPEVVFIPGYYTDVGNVALQARKLGIACPMLGGDGWDSEQLAKIAGDTIKGSFYSNHYAPDQPDEMVQGFIKRYQSEFKGKTPDGLAALGYDAAMVLFDAMKRAKTTDGKPLRDAIAATTNYKGVTGVITIDKNRDATKSAVIVEMKEGKPGEGLGPKYRATVRP